MNKNIINTLDQTFYLMHNLHKINTSTRNMYTVIHGTIQSTFS